MCSRKHLNRFCCPTKLDRRSTKIVSCCCKKSTSLFILASLSCQILLMVCCGLQLIVLLSSSSSSRVIIYIFDISGSKLFELKVRGLEARFFGGVTLGGHSSHDSASHTSSSKNSVVDASKSGDEMDLRVKSASEKDMNLQTMVGEGMAFMEDYYLTSANLCRWIIDFSEIQLGNGKQIGQGSYGVVYRGKWKGVDIAVKRFINQKLDERSMLEFRAEMAFLSELHHPNIVLFIGACVKKPNLCIVTEFVKQGSMKDILQNSSVNLPWMQRLKMLKSVALGVNYLHTLNPIIIHGDLKPSNLLVGACLTIISQQQ